MRNVLTFASFLVLIFGCAAVIPSWAPEGGRWEPTDYRDSVVRLEFGGATSGTNAVGTGVQVQPGIFVTAKHVVKTNLSGLATDRSGATFRVSTLWMSATTDLAVLSITGSALRPTKVAPVACRDPILGEPVITVGMPLDSSRWNYFWGHVSNDRLVDKMVVLDITAYPGNSGGPVFDNSGSVIGILVATWPSLFGGPGAMSLMVPITDWYGCADTN